MSTQISNNQLQPDLCSRLPKLGFGVSLHSSHFEWLLRNDLNPAAFTSLVRPVDWFEVISEHFLSDDGFTHYILDRIRERYPVVMHGVSLSIGTTAPANWHYLHRLNALIKGIQPAWVSDHICWSGISGTYSHDMLPLPYTEESLRHVIKRVNEVQDFLQRPLVLENPGCSLQFQHAGMSEIQFITTLCSETGCGLLLDINNLYHSSLNHHFDAEDYIRSLPHQQIVQMHLNGSVHCDRQSDQTHKATTSGQVWQLYQKAQQQAPDCPTLLEWDTSIPEFPHMVEALNQVRQALNKDLPVGEMRYKPGTILPNTGMTSQPIHDNLRTRYAESE